MKHRTLKALLRMVHFANPPLLEEVIRPQVRISDFFPISLIIQLLYNASQLEITHFHYIQLLFVLTEVVGSS